MAEGQIALPRLFTIFAHPFRKLQGADLRQGVVDGVERPQKQVGNPLPAGADLLSLVFRILPEGKVILLQPCPHIVALLPCQPGLFIDELLELVLLAFIEDQGYGLLQVHRAVILPAAAKEQLHMGRCEEFHGHGVGFRHFRGIPAPLPDFLIALEVKVEAMPALVAHDVGVLAGAVEVGENERRAVRFKLGAIASRLFSVPHGHVIKPSVQHEVNVLSRFGRDVSEHPPGHVQAERLIPQGRRIPLRKKDPAVIGIKPVQAQTLPSPLVQGCRHRHQICLHLLPEAPDVLRGIADAVHAQIAQLHKAGKSHQFCLPGPVFHKAVIDLLQLAALLLPGSNGRVIGFLPDLSVRRLLIPGKAAAADPLAAVIRPGVGYQLVVPAQQCVFFLLQGNDAAVIALQPRKDKAESEGSHGLLKKGGKGRLRQQPVEAVLQFAQPGADLIIVRLLPCIERVVDIHAMADIAQINGG